MKAIIYFDGACLPSNPGIACYGFVIEIENGKKISEYGIATPNGTNNVGEYTALVKSMEKALFIGITEVEIKGDSQLVINQMLGTYKVKAQNLIPLYQKAKELSKAFKKIEFKWIPREQNKEADKLAEKAYLEYVASSK